MVMKAGLLLLTVFTVAAIFWTQVFSVLMLALAACLLISALRDKPKFSIKA